MKINKKTMRVIGLLTALVMIYLSVLCVGCSKKPDEKSQEVLNPNTLPTSSTSLPTSPPPSPQISTEDPRNPIDNIDNPENHNNSTTQDPESSSEITTEIIPEPATPEPTTAPTENTENIRYIEAPKTDFIQSMFDNAIEIPGSQNKIEPPPPGRSEDLQYNIVPLSENIPDPFEYFKDIILLGDSVTTGFDLYRNRIKFNGESVIRDINVVAVGSYGVYNAVREISDSTIHPVFEGKQTYPEDVIAQKSAKNVLICLGLNDLTWMSTDNFIYYYTFLIDRIREKNPDKNIVIMSVTPVVAAQQKSGLTNTLVEKSNNALIKFAAENNLQYIDYAAALRDSENYLYDDLSSDNYCHLTITAYNRLIEYLLHHPIKN